MKTSDYTDLFHNGFSLDPRKTALLVIDMQYATACRTTGLGRLLKERGQERLGRYRFSRVEKWVIPNTLRLLRFFRKHRLKIIYITIGSRARDYNDLASNLRPLGRAVENRKGFPNHEILDELKPGKGERIVNKTTMSAFNSSSLDSILRTFGIAHLVVTGVSTNSCVEGTARDAVDKGYACLLVEDACGAASRKLHEAALNNFKRLLGRVEETSSVIREMKTALGRKKPYRRNAFQ